MKEKNKRKYKNLSIYCKIKNEIVCVYEKVSRNREGKKVFDRENVVAN